MHEIYQTENPAVCAVLAMVMPVSVYAAGEGNIDNGGGGMGAGTGTNFWSSHDEGVRVTVIRASDGAVASAPLTLPTSIRLISGCILESKQDFLQEWRRTFCKDGRLYVL